MKDLPQFRHRSRESVSAFLRDVLAISPEHGGTALVEVIAYEDGHFRVIFDLRYFTYQPGQTEPTRSQWNSLKKKLKRHDPRIFVFKEHGLSDHEGRRCGFLDFGFFAQ